jgi:predicted phosphodiesterase
MKLAIISDIHANLEALEAVLKDIDARGADRLVCLGDIVGYNASPAECIALLRRHDPLCVAGNHDRAVTGQITTDAFPHTAARAVEWTRPRLDADALAWLESLPLSASIDGELVAVHGALLPSGPSDMIRLQSEELRTLSAAALADHASGARVCAFGHTHDLGIFEMRAGLSRKCFGNEVSLRDDAFYLINPGTVGQPRAADARASYFMFDTDRRVVSIQRVRYDRAAALAKTRAAGLLPALSFLPVPVRKSLSWGVRAAGLSGLVTRARRRIAG